MGSSSVSTHRGLVHWQGLLLVVSLFNFWSQPTTALMMVESTDTLEGTDVTLHLRQKPPFVSYFLWYRGRNIDIHNNIAYLSLSPRRHITNPTAGGEAIIEDDGSLLLKNVTMKDSGFYTILVQLQGCQKMIACGRLTVYPLVSAPILRASKTTVREEDAVVLTCDTNHDAIQWLFKGTSLPLTDRMKLSRDRRNLIIDPVLRWDDGYYQCKASNPRNSGTSAMLKLNVNFG